MSKPTHKQLQDTLAAIDRGGEPALYVTSVSVADYQAELLCVEWYRDWALKLQQKATRPAYLDIVQQVGQDLRESAIKGGVNLHELTGKFCDQFYDDVMAALGRPE